MQEYSFVATNDAIYRVFGQSHPDDGILLLLRYYRNGNKWHKPPVYSAESLGHALLDHYEVPTRPVAHYGITLGVGPSNADVYREHFDPLHHEYDEDLANITSAIQCPVGLVGSWMVGLATEASDVDLVLYGKDGPAGGAQLLAEFAKYAHEPFGPSIAFAKFWKMTGGRFNRAEERNVFKGIIQWRGVGRKVDIHYAKSTEPVQTGGLIASTLQRPTVLRGYVVLDANERFYYPGWIWCGSGSRTVRVWILDHAIQYLLPGDTVTIRGTLVEHAGGVDVVGEELVSVDLVG